MTQPRQDQERDEAVAPVPDEAAGLYLRDGVGINLSGTRYFDGEYTAVANRRYRAILDVVSAARAWRELSGGFGFHEQAITALIAAVDALPPQAPEDVEVPPAPTEEEFASLPVLNLVGAEDHADCDPRLCAYAHAKRHGSEAQRGDSVPEPSDRPEVWRTGSHLGRTLYIQRGPEGSKSDLFVGMMETRNLAQTVVDAVNAQHSRIATVEAAALKGARYALDDLKARVSAEAHRARPDPSLAAIEMAAHAVEWFLEQIEEVREDLTDPEAIDGYFVADPEATDG